MVDVTGCLICALGSLKAARADIDAGRLVTAEVQLLVARSNLRNAQRALDTEAGDGD